MIPTVYELLHWLIRATAGRLTARQRPGSMSVLCARCSNFICINTVYQVNSCVRPAGNQQLWFLVSTQHHLSDPAMSLNCEWINYSVTHSIPERLACKKNKKWKMNHSVPLRVDGDCEHILISAHHEWRSDSVTLKNKKRGAAGES